MTYDGLKIHAGLKYEICLYFICLFLLLYFVFLRGQDRNWDLLNYHYYQGYSLLNGRFVMDIAAAGLQSFLNPITNVLAYLSLTHLAFPFSAWLILLIQFASVPAIVLLAKEIGILLGYPKSFLPAVPAIALSLLAPLWGSELGTTFFSSWTAALILWAVYFLFRSYQNGDCSKIRIGAAGLMLGLSVGLKLTNALYAASGLLMLAVLLSRSGFRATVLTGATFLASCCIGFLLTAWWNWHLWAAWGSPVFPLYNAIFKSEFYDTVNFRDTRWIFSSLQDILAFIFHSANVTSKTSEIPFADARYLLLAILIPVAMFFGNAARFHRKILAFTIFVSASFILWVFVLAYQRYFIPVELLLGLLIWILVARIFSSHQVRYAVMICLTLCAAVLIKVPDWGHAPIPSGGKNPFSIEMSAKLSSTPARYIVIGAPISYVIPTLHPESIFYGLGTSRQIDDLVFKRLSEASTLPLRILAKDSDAIMIQERLKRAGYNPLENSLDCNYFKTGLGRYIVCEAGFQKQTLAGRLVVVDADLSENGLLNAKGILWDRGLSHFEQWGRWSDGDMVEFGLSNCLPQGRLQLTVLAHAFGPNVGMPVKVSLGDKEMIFIFSDADHQHTAGVLNNETCIDKLIFTVPKATSPQSLGLSPDPRKLGVGFAHIEIVKE